MSHQTEITVLSDNGAAAPFAAEHGLSLRIRHRDADLLFDTGAGHALPVNLPLLVPEKNFPSSGIILSHGHYDHTGGLKLFSGCDLWHGPDADGPHFSLHSDGTLHDIAMPSAVRSGLNGFRCHRVDTFSEILPGIFLTGPIPRHSGEDTGGDFYLDADCTKTDTVHDEIALLLDTGILIQGCCHAGIINTLDHCRACRPDIPIHTVIGGLHLLHADRDRLDATASCLRSSGIRSLYLMHCTGADAIDYLRQALPDRAIHTPAAGSVLVF